MSKIDNLKHQQHLIILDNATISDLLTELHTWKVTKDKILYRELKFKDFKHTMLFINAVAYIAEKYHHHPDISFGYNYCNISLTTHDINGLSANDFICANAIEKLL